MKVGWQIRTLGEVCKFQRGLTYAKGDEVDTSNNIVLRASNIDVSSNLLDFNDLKFISDTISVPDSKKVKKDSILICTASGSKSHLGKVAFIDDDYDYAFGGFMGMITPSNGLNPKYLFHLMTSLQYKDFISGLADGVNINNLKFDDLKSFNIFFPSLAEQQRIVTILDEAFEGIATATANAKKNLTNALDLFEGYLQSIFTNKKNGWMMSHLKALTTKIGSGATPRGGEEAYKLQGVSLIRSLNVHDMSFHYRKLAFLDDAQAEGLSNVVIQTRDVLLNITGASVARCCIVPDDVLPARVNQHVSIIRPISEKLDAEFLHYLLISPPYKNQLLQTGGEGGSTRQAITKAQIENFLIVYPDSVTEQRLIVNRINLLREETKKLEAIYQQKLTALDELKKSILNQAFSGQLN